MISAFVKRKVGGFFAAVEEGFGIISENTGYEVALRNLDIFERINEAKCDAKERLWAGSTDRSLRKGEGRLD